MKEIYILEGGTGAWEDKSNWIVKAFVSEKAAEEHKLKCEEHYKNLLIKYKVEDYDALYFHSDYEGYNEINPYDPNGYMDYTGTFYSIKPVELEEA